MPQHAVILDLATGNGAIALMALGVSDQEQRHGAGHRMGKKAERRGDRHHRRGGGVKRAKPVVDMVNEIPHTRLPVPALDFLQPLLIGSARVRIPLQECQKELTQERKEKAALEHTIKDLETANEELADEVADLAEYKAKYEKLITKKKRASKKTAVVGLRKDEQREDVKLNIGTYVKEVTFRTVKFAQPGESIIEVTKSIWRGIRARFGLDKGPNALTEDDFVEIYDSHVMHELSARRQYCQTRCLNAAKGTMIR